MSAKQRRIGARHHLVPPRFEGLILGEQGRGSRRKQSAKFSIGGAIDEIIPQPEASVSVVRLGTLAAARRTQVQAVSADVA